MLTSSMLHILNDITSLFQLLYPQALLMLLPWYCRRLNTGVWTEQGGL